MLEGWLKRLKGDGNAVGLEVDEVALLNCVSDDALLQLMEGRSRLTSASPVGQQAATLEPHFCWMGTATVRDC